MKISYLIAGILLAAQAMPTLTTNTFAATNVKVSKNGFCHDSNSPQFKQVVTTSDSGFNDLTSCVAAGYKLPSFYQKQYPELYLVGLNNRKEALEKTLAAGSAPAQVKADQIVAASKEIAAVEKEIAEAEQEAKNNMNFQGFNWNPALAALFYNDKVISDISITAPGADGKGRVQIGKEYDTQTALMIEVHYFVRSDVLKDTLGGSAWGWGPFIATSAGGTEKASLGTVFGAGLMAGMKTEGRNSMNIGIGWFTDQDITVLRDELIDGSYTTVTDSAALIRKTNGEGWFLMFSASF